MLVKRVVFALQKYGFCRAKRWFLHCKKVVFVLPTINIRGTTTVLVLYEYYVIANSSQCNWQTVSSRRGPIYRARIYVYTHVMGNGNACAVMWKCVFNETDTRFCLCQDTGTMNRPLRLTVCSLRISRCVCWHFAECSPRNWQTISNVLADRQQP